MTDLKSLIIGVLSENPDGIKAKKIAKILGLETASSVNSILYSFPEEFSVNENYEWTYQGNSIISNIRSNESFSAQKKIKDNRPYHYYNCNPQRRLTDDCVIRAISSLTGDSWEDVFRALTEMAIKTGYMLNTPECYGEYLEELGFTKRKQPTKKDGKKIKFKEFVISFDGHAFCHCGKGHVTYVADNSTWDIWDVSEEIVGVYWSSDN